MISILEPSARRFEETSAHFAVLLVISRLNQTVDWLVGETPLHGRAEQLFGGLIGKKNSIGGKIGHDDRDVVANVGQQVKPGNGGRDGHFSLIPAFSCSLWISYSICDRRAKF